MNEFRRRLQFLLHRKQFESELEEEFQHHLALTGQKQFGNPAFIKEESRRMWRSIFWEQLARELREYGRVSTAIARVIEAL